MTDPIVVRAAAADEIRPLRMAVLRPGLPVEPSDYDRRDDAHHIGAFAGEEAVGCASVFPSPYDGQPAWQLRGMAVVASRQGAGVGRIVLAAAVDAAQRAGAPLVWANARVSALGFYQRAGFEVVSEEFVYGPSALPHRVILRRCVSTAGSS